MAFFNANYNITKLSKNAKGEITELWLNNQRVPLTSEGMKLYAWKYSSSYIYTKELFSESVNDVTTYGGSPLAKATTGDYVAAHTNNIWKIGSTFYNADMTSGSAPKGSAGTAVTVGKVYIATSEDEGLTNGKWYTYTGEGESIKYYLVSALTTDGVTLGTEVTAAAAVATLEAATFSDLKYVPYAEGEKIVYDSHDYYRYSTSDITLK